MASSSTYDSFTATTRFKSSRSFVSLCVCCMLCRMRQSRILQSMQHTQGDTKERELSKCVVAVKESYVEEDAIYTT